MNNAECCARKLRGILMARVCECGYVDYDELAEWLLDQPGVVSGFNDAYDTVIAWAKEQAYGPAYR